jgi:hypothetical protein
MPYVVCEDLADASETKVHRTDCRHYADRDRDATTMRWSAPFDDADAARREALRVAAGKRHGARDAECCM